MADTGSLLLFFTVKGRGQIEVGGPKKNRRGQLFKVMNSNDCCFLVHIIMPIAAILLFLYLSLLPHSTEGKEADLILLTDPGEAVCLDGSPPGYYFRPGNNHQLHVILKDGTAKSVSGIN